MRKTLFTLVLLCLTICSFSQKLTFESSFDAAKAKAKASGKKVMVYLTPSRELPVPSPPKGIVFPNTQLLEDPKSIEIIRDNFILHKSKSGLEEAEKLKKDYNITRIPSYLFFHPNGDIFYILQSNFSQAGNFDKQVSEAVLAGKKPTLTEQKDKFAENPVDLNALKSLIESRKKLGINDNNDLLELFSSKSTKSMIDDYNTTLYVLENGPYVFSETYNIYFQRNKVKDSIYRKEPLAKRVSINNAIINNSMNKAILEKNFEKAMRTAYFARSTWGADEANGNKNFKYRMMNYNLAVSDTSRYLKEVFDYVDSYIYSKSDSQVLEEEKRRIQSTIAQNKRQNPGVDFYTEDQADSLRKKNISKPSFEKLVNAGGKVTLSNRTFAVIRSNAGGELFIYARHIYNTGTDNKEYLSKALTWVNKALAFNKRSNFLETKAYLQHKLGFKTEALSTMKEIVAMEQSDPLVSRTAQESLKNMLSGKDIKLM